MKTFRENRGFQNDLHSPPYQIWHEYNLLAFLYKGHQFVPAEACFTSVRPSSNMTERPAAPCFDLSRRAGRPRRGGRGVTCGDDIGGGGRGNPQAGPPVPTGCATTARTRGSTPCRTSWATCWWRATRCPAAWVCSAAEAATGTDTGGRARPWWQKTRMTALTAATAVMTTSTTEAAASEVRVEPADS